MNKRKLLVTLDFTETIIDHAELLLAVFGSDRVIEDKMEFLFAWLDNFKNEVEDHPCKEYINQLKDEIQSGNVSYD